MASSSLESPAPLKNKLYQIRYLLDDANKRLQEEASNFEIFATETSATAGTSTLKTTSLQQQQVKDTIPSDLTRTISDISTLKSVLSCPIFNRIVNVTDSLDRLSYQLNLHPSIGPSDIDIDSNGELILAPPIEPTSLNNIINSKLDGYSDYSNNSPGLISPTLRLNSTTIVNGQQQQFRQQAPSISSNLNASSDEITCIDGYHPVQSDQHAKENLRINNKQQNMNDVSHANQANLKSESNSQSSYDTEKLVANGASKKVINGLPRQFKGTESSAIPNDEDRKRRLFENVNGQTTMTETDSRCNFERVQSVDRITNEFEPREIGYSNEMYKTTYELNQQKAIDHYQPQLNKMRLNEQNLDSYASKILSYNSSMNGKIHPPVAQCIRSSCSPSTSAGSTVKLADECDSGASSYQSQTQTKGNMFVTYPQRLIEQSIVNETDPSKKFDSIEPEYMDKFSSEMEKIKVTLEKDNNGIGITIAGYTCEEEEISGIFIKSITPNSPADRSGKIRILDQIFAVNGRELLGYSNPESVNVLRHTGKIVTLELMRYIAESKYKKLQSVFAHAQPSLSTSSINSNQLAQDTASVKFNNEEEIVTNNSNIISIPSDKSDPKYVENGSPSRMNVESVVAMPTVVQVLNNSDTIDSNGHQEIDVEEEEESLYKNALVSKQINNFDNNSSAGGSPIKHDLEYNSTPPQSHIPVAAQRGGTNKVIETKQGARNTVNIRSPACQAASFIVKTNELEIDCDSGKKSVTARLLSEACDELDRLVRTEEPEWEKSVQIIELCKDNSQGLGFAVKEYANPKDKSQPIIMITSLTPGGIAEKDGRLSVGDLLIFVDDIDLKGATLSETVRALKRTNGLIKLGVLKLKRNS